MADVEAQFADNASNWQQNNGAAASMFKKANRPITLTFENVIFKIHQQKRGGVGVGGGDVFKKQAKVEERIILKEVTGIVKAGEMLAMLGPSGSGKTTLLTALGGRLGGELFGNIRYNCCPFSKDLKRSIGFVTQDDILYEHLTVTETLVYAALLRLPNDLTAEEKVGHAESVLAQLGLVRCKHNIIGGHTVRGISGGERKRVSIGQEMLINPSLLFLDEPTSGLDSTTAQRIVSTLAELAKSGGRTIVMTIHQPSSRLFYMFNKVLLLSEGNPLYFGNGDHEVMRYFEGVGFAPTVAMNPADFLLDLANGISPDDSQNDPTVVKRTLVTVYKEHLRNKLVLEVQQEANQVDMIHNNDNKNIHDNKFVVIDGKWATTWWQQFVVLLQRGIKERKHDSFSALMIIQVLISALLAGLLWFRSDRSHLQDQVGLLFFYTGFWGFYPLFQAIYTFPSERLMLAKERSSGMYRLSSYFVARTVGDLPMELVLPTGFVLIVYWMTGLKPTACAFFYNLIALLLSVLVYQGLGLALGAVCLDQKKATVLGSVLMLAFMLAGGFFVENVPKYVSWIKYLSVMQYTYKLMLGSQYDMEDTYYPCNNNNIASKSSGCLVKDFPLIKSVGLDDQYVAVIALLIMLVGYRLIAYIALMRIGAPSLAS